MGNLRVAVLGLGFIGEIHARIFSENPNSELVLVVDKNVEKAKEIAARFNCEYASTLTKGCEKVSASAVSICTPDIYHLENVQEATNLSLDILLEKPIAKTKEESQKIVKICEEAGLRIMIAHVLQFDPRYAQLRESIFNEKFGEIIHMYFRRTNPRANGRRLKGEVSIMHFIGVHDFEMLCTYMRSKPVRVYSQMVSKINADIGCEDTVISIITFENGAIGLIELSWALPNNSSLGIGAFAEVVGTKSVGFIDIHNQGISIINEDEVLYPDTLHWPEYNGQIHGDLKEELHHFVQSILNNREFITELETAIQAVEIIEACQKSIETGNPIIL